MENKAQGHGGQVRQKQASGGDSSRRDEREDEERCSLRTAEIRWGRRSGIIIRIDRITEYTTGYPYWVLFILIYNLWNCSIYSSGREYA